MVCLKNQGQCDRVVGEEKDMSWDRWAGARLSRPFRLGQAGSFEHSRTGSQLQSRIELGDQRGSRRPWRGRGGVFIAVPVKQWLKSCTLETRMYLVPSKGYIMSVVAVTV